MFVPKNPPFFISFEMNLPNSVVTVYELQRRLNPEKFTLQEANAFRSLLDNMIKGFTVGVVVGSGLTRIATRRLIWFNRMSLGMVFPPLTGLLGASCSMDLCIDDILALEGSRMQKELLSLILQRFPDNPRRMQLLSKHFYSERVFDDSTSDQLKLRWRDRNFYVNNAANSQSTPSSDYQSDSDSKQNDLESKQVPMNSCISLMADPFDCIFGHSATGEESCHPDTSSVRPRGLNRSHKHRRRRLHQQNVSQTLNTR